MIEVFIKMSWKHISILNVPFSMVFSYSPYLVLNCSNPFFPLYTQVQGLYILYAMEVDQVSKFFKMKTWQIQVQYPTHSFMLFSTYLYLYGLCLNVVLFSIRWFMRHTCCKVRCFKSLSLDINKSIVCVQRKFQILTYFEQRMQ